jgi:putative ABC transport system permease protein
VMSRKSGHPEKPPLPGESGSGFLESLARDLRRAAKHLFRSPTFTVPAVLCLALGIGATSTVFSVVNAVLLRDLPYTDPDRLVMVRGVIPAQGLTRSTASAAEFRDYQEQKEIFTDVAGAASRFLNLTGSGEPRRLFAGRVSINLFPLLGVHPARGRYFLPQEGEAGESRVAILSHALWRQVFGADPRVVGRSIQLGGEPFTVIGVMPAGFRFRYAPEDHDLWIPLVLAREKPARDFRALHVVARLRPGVPLERAQAQMDVLARRFQSNYPEVYAQGEGWDIDLTPVYEELVGDARRILVMLLAAVALLLLIACSNVANLLLARWMVRQKELAVKMALGASRSGLFRQCLAESLVLALAAGILGLLFAIWAVKALAATTVEIPRLEEAGVDGWVLAFTLGVSLATVLFSGLIPAAHGSRPDLQRILRGEGQQLQAGSRRLPIRNALVVAQVALSLMMLVGAGLLVRSFSRLQKVDPGFRPERLLTFQLYLPPTRYADGVQQVDFCRRLLDHLQSLSGVESAALTNSLPLGEIRNLLDTEVEGQQQVPAGQTKPLSDWRIVSPEYFRTMGIPLLAGRPFRESDDAAALAVAVVDETFAQRFWPGQSPIGKRLRLSGRPDGVDEWLSVVGVVGHVRSLGLDAESREQVYTPFFQSPVPFVAVALRTAGDPLRVTAGARTAVWAVDRDQPVDRVRPMEEILAGSVATRRAYTLYLVLFAGGALLLTTVGMAGVMFYSVEQRTHEIGVRMAVGARASEILRLVLQQGLVLVGLGIAVGLLAAVFLKRIVSGLLYGVEATDGATIVLVVLLLLGTALISALLPAWRATRVSPIEILRGGGR